MKPPIPLVLKNTIAVALALVVAALAFKARAGDFYIFEVHDTGTPKLWAYRRVGVQIEPGTASKPD